KPAGTPGGLKVLNWAGFTAAISYNFDDANSSHLSNYASMLKPLGIPFTFYLIGNKISTAQSQWNQIFKDGHEMGNHTQDHNTISQANVDNGQTSIESMITGAKVETMASPNGDEGYNPFAQARYFLQRGADRNSSGDTIMMPGNETTPSPIELFCYIPPTGATQAMFDAQVSDAQSKGGWKIILVHGFTGGTDSAFQPVPIAEYVASAQKTRMMADLWIDTMVNVGAYWRGQNAFNQATMSGTPTSGGQTWKWTLPAHFPTGKFLRVTVTGGTLTQNGQPLAWNTHGYYEVALDVGQLTLTQ
ncbi:MAG: polysaccharide deacetylase family protein, partial [Myxococcales bacterium]|nr:polysaccharide deacetylase family protein [Myxococcales bacterium]